MEIIQFRAISYLYLEIRKHKRFIEISFSKVQQRYGVGIFRLCKTFTNMKTKRNTSHLPEPCRLIDVRVLNTEKGWSPYNVVQCWTSNVTFLFWGRSNVIPYIENPRDLRKGFFVVSHPLYHFQVLYVCMCMYSKEVFIIFVETGYFA